MEGKDALKNGQFCWPHGTGSGTRKGGRPFIPGLCSLQAKSLIQEDLQMAKFFSSGFFSSLSSYRTWIRSFEKMCFVYKDTRTSFCSIRCNILKIFIILSLFQYPYSNTFLLHFTGILGPFCSLKNPFLDNSDEFLAYFIYQFSTLKVVKWLL